VKIHLDTSAPREAQAHDYAYRFVFGGLVTALAGVIAKISGPVVGGLFLAFPAIFPAACSLTQSHQKRRKAEAGCDGTARGKNAAAINAFGAALGTLGLMAFALALWKLITITAPAITLLVGAAAWLAVTLGAYKVHECL